MAWLESFMGYTAGLIEKPPYLTYLFIGAVFVSISLISQYGFEKTFIFFLYSVGGTMWRYIEKDLVGKNFVAKIDDEKDKKEESLSFIQRPSYRRTIVTIYHLGNLGLFVALIHYLGFI